MSVHRRVFAVLVGVLTCLWLGSFPAWQAHAQSLPITVDPHAPGTPAVVGHQGGVPVIQIAPPSAGVSNNAFTEFNVGPAGVILNNSGVASQTQLAGQIAGNPHLGRGAATTILNQVTAPNPSQLRGLLEVAGQRANVIVANPAGITCDGCGFVNASRATLTTGRPVVGPDGGMRFEITEGALQVNGQGLQVGNVSQTDLLARAIQINAAVWADHLNVVAGAARVDGVSGEVTPIAGHGPAPQVSLDMAAIGGMYANAIRLIGTEHGLGVNMGGALVSHAGEISVTAEGDVRIVPHGRVQAQGEVYLRAPRIESRGHIEGQHVAIRADTLVNLGGTMRAAGDIDITAESFQNLNANFASHTVEVSSTPKTFYTPGGSTDMYDAATAWLCDTVTPGCAKHPGWLNNDPERRLLLPSARYPEAQYGPPFDYVPHQRGRAGFTSPIALSLTPSRQRCRGDGGDAGCDWITTPDQFHYAPHGRIWQAFGVAPPQGALPVWNDPKEQRLRRSDTRPRVTTKPHNRPTPERRAYEANLNAYKAPYVELDTRIRAFNEDFEHRLVKDFTYYEVHDKVTETRRTHSEPARVLAGGSIALRGKVTNDKSQIVAGERLTIAGPALHNHGATGERRVTREGQATFTQARRKGRSEHRSPYHVTLSSEPIQLPVGASDAFPAGALHEQAEYPTLISGRDTFISVSDGVHNSGVIAPRETAVIHAGDIVNHDGGHIQGRLVDLQARESIRNTASRIEGDIVLLRAGQDIDLNSVVASEDVGSTSGTHLAGISQVKASELTAVAGQDLNMLAADVSVDGDAHLRAGRDVHLDPLTTHHAESIVGNAHNRHALHRSADQGTTITVDGNLTMAAGQDISATAAQINAQQHLAIDSGRDVDIRAGQDSGSAMQYTQYKKKKLLSSKTTKRIVVVKRQRAQASTLSGESIDVKAGRDMKVTGSNLVADQDIDIAMGGDAVVQGAAERYETYQHQQTKRSGLGKGSGFSLGYSKQSRTDTFEGASTGYAGSTLGSVDGDVGLDAGGDIRIVASSLLAQRGTIALEAPDVEIAAAIGRADEHERHAFSQSGLTVGIAGGVLGAAQQIQHTMREAEDTSNSRLAAVKAGQAAYAAMQTARTMSADASGSDTDGQAVSDKKAKDQTQIQISVGKTRSVSDTTRTEETVFGSSVIAGGKVHIVARDKAREAGDANAIDGDADTTGGLGSQASSGSVEGIAGGNIKVVGSDIVGENIVFDAANDVILQGAAQTSTETSTHTHGGGKLGVGVGASDSGSGVNVFASGYQGHGRAQGHGTTHRETQIFATERLSLKSGRDTTLIGALAHADHLDVDTGRNLTMISQQDVDRYDAKQHGVNGGATFSFGTMSGSANVGANLGKTHSTYDSVNEQTGLHAGARGFAITVGGHTQLTGAAISSEADAAKNRLSTQTFGFEDIDNQAAYRATAAGMSIGTVGIFDLLENQGNMLGGLPGGASLASTRGTRSDTTRAAVAEGTIDVRADALKGHDSLAGLSRDTDHANGRIDRIFDKKKVQDQLEFQQAFAQLGMQIAGDVAAQLQQDNPELWSDNGAGRIALHAAVAGLGAALGGGDIGGAIVGTVAGDITANLLRDHIEQAVQNLPPGSREAVSKVIVNVVATTAGGLAGGLSGAGGAAAADRFNRQLHPDEGDLIRQHAERYAKRQDISVEQARAELTGQAQRQTDLRAAEYYPENPAAREFLTEIATDLHGNGFAYFDGQSDQSHHNELQSAGALYDNDNLGDLYDGAWQHLRASQPHLSKLSGVTRAQIDAAEDIDHYAANARDLDKVVQALEDERDRLDVLGEEKLANVFNSKLQTIRAVQNGGFLDLNDLTLEEKLALGTAMPSLEGRARQTRLPAISKETKANVVVEQKKKGREQSSAEFNARSASSDSKKYDRTNGISAHGAENANTQAALKAKLSGLQKAQQTAVATKTLSDGRIRYYSREVPAAKAGKTRGASFVTEFDPKTGNTRQWMESYDHSGAVNRVHPKSINGQPVNAQHYPPTGTELKNWESQ